MFDFNLIQAFFEDFDVRIERNGDTELTAVIADDIRLSFFNAENERDSLWTFGTGWHCHGDITFFDENGYYENFSCLDFFEELAKGKVLLCSDYINGTLYDMYPAHTDYFDKNDFSRMLPNEELRLRRIILKEKE